MFNFKKLFLTLEYYFRKERGIYFPNLRDRLYVFQQNKLRGLFPQVKENQKIYLPFIKQVPANILNKYPFIDLGFGRGEFLELLQENNIPTVIGVDTNVEYVKKAKEKGFEVYKDDCVKFLYLYDRQFSGISAFHLIEHLSFGQFFDLILLANKKLASGGVLMIETPNIENLIVSGTTFYYDYTHKCKFPKHLIQTMLEFIGFSQIEFIPLHPIKVQPKNKIENLLFGSQDMGIIAFKT